MLRGFLGLILGLALVLDAHAQQAPGVHRIGFLGNSTAALEVNLVGPFREGLRALGYIEGTNIHVEYRWAEGKYERLPALVAELIAARVEVIVTAGTPASLAVKKATTTIPLVMVAVGDPVATGFADTLGRPGGNATGLASIAPDMEGKRLQLLRDLLPEITQVAVLRNPSNLFHVGSSENAQEAAHLMGIALRFVDARTSEEMADAFAAVARYRPQALVVFADRVFLHNRKLIADFALRSHLPTAVTHQELVEAGALFSFGANYPDMHRRAARYVDQILKGARPAEMPIEQPTRFELVINRRTSQALGLPIPPPLLLQADRIID